MTRPDRANMERGTPLLMVRPASFGFDEETALTNAFQARVDVDDDVSRLAQAEFDGLVAALRRAGIEVLVFEDSPDPIKPSAVFPNNWVSFHGDGTVVLYPMATESRRREVRAEWIEALGSRYGFQVTRVLDLRLPAVADRYLEGTGSLVLDRDQRLAYAALSPRTDPELARRFSAEFDYELVALRAVDTDGVPIYHTNVMMSVGPGAALVCFEALPDAQQREDLRARLTGPARVLVELSWEQACSFAGNALEVARPARQPALVMSAAARACLTDEQLAVLESRVEIVSSPLATIERLGGGSARCMVTAVHLPRESGRREEP